MATKRYRGEGWEVRVGRWQDSPPKPDQVDHVLGDPPYDPETHAGGRRAHRQPNGICEEMLKSFDPITPATIARPLIQLAQRWVVLFCSSEMLGEYRIAANFGMQAWIRAGWWIKTDPTPQFSGDRPATPGDGLAIMHRGGLAIMHQEGRKAWNGGGKAAVWIHRTARGEERLHETPKPVGLMVQLVRDFTDPGDMVWDPYCGAAASTAGSGSAVGSLATSWTRPWPCWRPSGSTPKRTARRSSTPAGARRRCSSCSVRTCSRPTGRRNY